MPGQYIAVCVQHEDRMVVYAFHEQAQPVLGSGQLLRPLQHPGFEKAVGVLDRDPLPAADSR